MFYVLFAELAGRFPDQKWILYIYPFVRLIDFGLGMMLCARIKDRISKDREDSSKKTTGMLLQTGSIVLMAGLVIGYGSVPRPLSYGIIYILPSLFCIFSFLCYDTWLVRFLKHKFWHAVSMLSMEMYLVHQLVIRYLDEYSREMRYINGYSYIMMICAGTVAAALYLRFFCGKVHEKLYSASGLVKNK